MSLKSYVPYMVVYCASLAVLVMSLQTEESSQDKEDVTSQEHDGTDTTLQEQDVREALEEDSQEMEETVDLSIDEKQMLLQALQFKR